MPKMEELLRLVNEASSRTARIQALAAKMDTPHEHTLDDYDANLLSAHLEIVIDHLRTVQGMASYLSRPIKVSAPVIKCQKTPRKKCRFVAEVRKKR